MATRLKAENVNNIGIVFNLHHGHDHLDGLAEALAKMKPHLLCLNLNGTNQESREAIIPLGQGSRDLGVLRTIVQSGYDGPIGLLGHTQDDAEERLRDNLEGLDWLVGQLKDNPPGERPKPRTYPQSATGASSKARKPSEFDPKLIRHYVDDALAHGNARRGSLIFSNMKYGCMTCHKLGAEGGVVGPDLSEVGKSLSSEAIVESVLWPQRVVKEGYRAAAVALSDGRLIQGVVERQTDSELEIKEAATGSRIKIAKKDVEDQRELGSLMPDGLADAMTEADRLDLFRFLIDQKASSTGVTAHAGPHAPAEFSYTREPIHPELWPNWKQYVNRDRVYDFYAREADYFSKQRLMPSLLPPFPGLDGGKLGHWGNQNDDNWIDDRWNQADLGTVMSGIFRGGANVVPKGVCLRLGERGEMSACFNPQSLTYEALWTGGFVKFSARRHGFMDGLLMDGKSLPLPEQTKLDQPIVYHGFYRYGSRVVFSYKIGEVEMLDAPWAEDGKFSHVVAPAKDHPLASYTRGGPAQRATILESHGSTENRKPYAVDTIAPPFDNPWRIPLFFGGHDFLPDGAAYLCTMEGDVWRVNGLDETLQHVQWRRFATGLHQALGLVCAQGKIFVLGRDQITCLHDLNNDGEADFYECVTNAYETSTAGHDFICGLERDDKGRFYTVSGKQGLIRLTPGKSEVEVLATGFRNADGLALGPDGTITVPASEGEWTPSSMVCEIKKGGYYGYGGPKNGAPPDLPLVYIPRGLDNSSGAQCRVSSNRWGPLEGQYLHFSYGAGTHFLLLRETVNSRPQGAVVPLPGDFRSGVHRGRFNPKDGQLYVTGMSGWGTYTVDDGCFQRVRYTGGPVRLPLAYHVRANGVLLTFSEPIDREIANKADNHFAQSWNYRYSAGYGSPELASRHPGAAGHDPLAIRSAHVLEDGLTLFLETPDIQPVNQLHLHVKIDSGDAIDVFGTVHELGEAFTGFPEWKAEKKEIAAHPILSDVKMATKSVPNPWRDRLPGARSVTIEAGKNLTYSPTHIKVRSGEVIKLTFINPDVVPHNWALARPGALARVGDLANKLIADPDAYVRNYIPKTDDVLYFTDIVNPSDQSSIYFRAPVERGRDPYLCTFPGHWMVMNGVMVVE